MHVKCLVKYLVHIKNSGNTIISVIMALNSLTPSYSSGALGSNFIIFRLQRMLTRFWECECIWKLLNSNSRERTLDRQMAGSWDPLLSLFSLRTPHNPLVGLPLFTAAWWVPPFPAAECWSCLQSPAWRAGCPTQQTGGLAQPGAIWMWATWTCDKKQKPWWGGRPSLQHKIKQPNEEGMERHREEKNLFRTKGRN